MTNKTIDFVNQKIKEGLKVALITITATSGSSPASVGQIMAVTADGSSSGTVGGGASEHAVAQLAAAAINDGKKVFEFSFDHSEQGMVCGGGMTGFGNILGSENHLYIFGGGHVAQRLAPIALATGFAVTIIEDRPDLASEFSDEVDYIVTTPEQYADKIKFNASPYIVIATRGHSTDSEALDFCINKPFNYLGMIGSKKKVTHTREKLEQQGISEELMNKIYAPVGLNVASGVPAEIAISIVAEILLVKNGGSVESKSNYFAKKD